MALNNVIRLGSNLLLTRLLAPDTYGLMAVGNVIVSALILLSDIGLGQSVMHSHRGEDPKFLNTVWSIRMLRGVTLSAILVVIAGLLTGARLLAPMLVSGTYADPRLLTVMLVLAVFPITDGFESTNTMLCRRVVNLRPIVLVDLGSQVLSTIFMAAMAFAHPSIWVLPAGWVCYSVFKSLGSFLINGPGNRLQWDKSCANEIWHFSKWILISSSLTFAYREGDRLVLGGLLTASEMGVYGVSLLLLGAVKQVAGSLSNAVGLPALAEIARSRPAQLARAYRRCRVPIDVLCLGIGGFIFAAADLLIRVLYDQRYQGAAPLLRLVSLILVAHRYIVFDDFLVATGNTRQLFKRGVLQVIVLVASLPIGYHLGGVEGAVIGVVLANFSTIPLILFLEARFGIFDWREELKILPVFAAGAAVGYFVNLISLRWFH